MGTHAPAVVIQTGQIIKRQCVLLFGGFFQPMGGFFQIFAHKFAVEEHHAQIGLRFGQAEFGKVDQIDGRDGQPVTPLIQTRRGVGYMLREPKAE